MSATMEEHMEQKLLSVKGLSEYLSLPRSSIYTMVSRGKLPGIVHLGRALRFERATIDAWVSGQRAEQGSDKPQELS